jgi:ATP synthase F1 gamma subunit
MIDVKTEILELGSFKEIAQTYQEVAALRMRKIKDFVLKNREFLSGLATVFARVRLSYEVGLKEFLKSQGIKTEEAQQEYIGKMNFTLKNGRDALIFISANTGLYGDIITRIFNYFCKHIDTKSDIVIVGRVGKILFEQRFPGKDYVYFELSDNAPEPELVNKIINNLAPYEHIIVFHGKYKDILDQVPSQTSISGDRLSLEVKEDLKKINCIFEPNIEEVFNFFEKEIKTTLFDQSLYEASLSKFTSRMVSLDGATNNATDKLDKLRLQRDILKHRKADKEKNTVLSSVVFGV